MDRRVTSVLVVEDNLGDARLIQEYLRESQTLDAQIDIVSTLGEAVEALNARQFDIVLLDLSLFGFVSVVIAEWVGGSVLLFCVMSSGWIVYRWAGDQSWRTT